MQTSHAAEESQAAAPLPLPLSRGLSMRAKLFGAVGAACLVVLALTGAALRVLCDNISQAAQLEARNLATSVALGAVYMPKELQRYVAQVGGLYRRDVFILDRNRRTVADIVPEEVGDVYREDRNGEIDQTMTDGTARGFVETSAQHPKGALQLAVPLRATAAADAAIVGAVVVEYTDIEQQLLHASAWSLYAVGLSGCLAALLIGAFGHRVVSRVANGIGQVHRAVQAFAAGEAAVRVEPVDNDEVGELTLAFNRMTTELEANRRDLRLETEMAREAARQAEFLAYTDPLTGLPNRAQFSRLMSEALMRAAQTGQSVGVLFIDLDRFKNVNDTLGHAAGDSLLFEVARRLNQCLSPYKRIARLGGDEFVVIVPGVEASAWLGGVARKILTTISQPLCIGRQELRVTSSIGISVYPRDGRDEHTLMKHADIAMYQAKDGGRDGYEFYSPELNRHSIEQLAFASELQRAIEQEQLRVHYQPKVEAVSGRIVGVEALVRWLHPAMGSVAPGRFIPVAEETGLIVPLGRWVLEQACRQQMAWRAQGLPPLTMAVNLSPRQFGDARLIDDVRHIIEASGIEPGLLELEITESLLVKGDGSCAQQLFELKHLGVRLAVDDFGTGYSSLAHLRHLPVDTLKIDRAFVRNLEDEPEDRAITRAIVALGRSLNLRIVAEGVETDGQYAYLIEQGCDEIQGFYFGRPVEAQALAKQLGRQCSGRGAEYRAVAS